MNSFTVSNISNYYGGLTVFKKDGKYFWTVDCDTDMSNVSEIPTELGELLFKLQDKLVNGISV